MATEGGSAQLGAPAAATATAGPNPVEKYPTEGSQVQTYQYYPSAMGSTAVTWPAHVTDNSNPGNGTQNLSYQYNPQPSTSVQDGTNVPSHSSTSTAPGTDNASHVYTSFATYPTSTNPYSYGSSEYANYYSNYQQQSNQPYPHAQGAYQNTGSPYQPISSFQNTGSYAGPTSYSGTYYNPGNYQTTGAYTGSDYGSQANTWNQGTYAHYYANYSQDSNSTYSSTNAATTTNPSYQQHYKQWEDYYNSQTEVTCAPGTETPTITNAAPASCPIPSVSSGYVTPASQSQPSYAPAWNPEPAACIASSVQIGNTSGAYDDYWKHATQIFQNQHVSIAQSDLQKAADVNSYPSSQGQQQNAPLHVPSAQYTSAPQMQQIHQQPSLPPPPPPADAHKVSKLQIPTNPRIAANLAFGLAKSGKDTSTSSVTTKPAYVSVSAPKLNEKVLSTNASDPSFKPGVFPASLKGYVERALARCKDEKQRAASQEIMKELITNATADGTLYSRDWDTEPLFPLPDANAVNNEQSAASVFSLSTFRRSPSRRTKSRWEPLPEEKPVEKPTSTFQDSAKHGVWIPYNGRDRKFTSGKAENRDAIVSKYSTAVSNASRSAPRPVKKQRFGSELGTSVNGDVSSDSDKEHGLTAYYSGAVALANSPEERKRRENRSKRFEKGNGQRSENQFRPRNFGAGNLYVRRATATALSRTSDDGDAKAVEDIDWDALTVKGTCQEIEKRYLRLTSAPDPSTVRPEEVLEKALLMVQKSEKNYYFKCDQLKSIRQDLTVQRIRNELTVKVYETHARLALEFGDMPEYNQCRSQLKSLYAEGIAGCHLEFSAYNLLSVILHASNRRELLSLMSRLSDEAKQHEAVRHALSVRAAVASGNYVLFFKLYKTAPNLNTYLMDLCVEKMRFEAVKCISRAYRPTVSVQYITQVLGFSGESESGDGEEKDVDGMEECTEWLKAHGACLFEDTNGEMVLDAKASSASLFMPEPEDAVAHGDANLAVNDFLTRAPS